MPQWMVRSLGSEPAGPYTTEQIVSAVDEGDLGVELEVTPVGEDKWLPIEMVPEFADLAFFDGETNVVDSPWFADLARRGAMAPRKISDPLMQAARPAQEEPVTEELRVPPGFLAQQKEKSHPPPIPTRAKEVTSPPRPSAQSSAAPAHAIPTAGDRPYDNDDVATKVVSSPAEMALAAQEVEIAARRRGAHQEIDETLDDDRPEVSTQVSPQDEPPQQLSVPMPASTSQPGDLFDDFDETMTRVRLEPTDPEPRPAPPGGGGVLPTLTMNRDYLPATVNQPVVDPPPASPHGHVGQFPAAPAVDPLAATAVPVAAAAASSYPPVQPQSAYPQAPQPNPAGYDPAQAAVPYDPAQVMHYPPPQQGYPYAEPEAEGSDSGVKALIVLIVILAMALTVVMVLLISQP